MKTSKLNKYSLRQKLINTGKGIIREILKLERGNKCEFCGKAQDQLRFPLSLFHIIPVSKAPRLVLVKENLMLACWNKEKFYYIKSPSCHNIWEHQKFLKDGSINPKWRQIELKIKSLYGEDYKDKLMMMSKTIGKLDMFRIKLYIEYYKKELAKLKE